MIRTVPRSVWYGLLLLTAFGIRAISGSGLFLAPADAKHRTFEMFDSSYQIRRVWLTVDHYPHVPFHDRYHYYPDNPRIPWPIGYTLFLATLAKPLAVLGVSPITIETLLGYVPCVVDAITVLLFVIFFRRYTSDPVALLAGVLLTFSSQNVGYAEAGYIDHHYFITFLIALWCVVLLRYEQLRTQRRAVCLGIALGLGSFFNVSSIQYAAILLGVALLIPAERRVFLGLLAATLTAALFTALIHPAGRAGEIRYDETSLFQFYFLLAIALAGCAFRFRKHPAALAALVATAGGFVFWIWGDLREAARFVIAGNRLNWIQGEEASIRDYFDIWPSIFTWFVFVFPIGVYALWRDYRKHPFFLAVTALLLAHGLLTGLSHYLYVQYLFPWFAIVVSLGFFELVRLLTPYAGGFHWLIAVPLVSQLGWRVWNEQIHKTPDEQRQRNAIVQTVQAFAWLRENSPPTSVQGEPEYSVFAHRDHGHQLVLFGERPVIVSPFSTPAFTEHLKDYARATMTREESVFLEICRRYRAKYVVLDNRDNTMTDFYMGVLKGEPDEQTLKDGMHERVFSFRNNLFLFDGELRWKKTPSVEHFRLVYETPARIDLPLRANGQTIRHRVNGLKIFEIVEGREIRSSGHKPGERVVVQIPQKTNTGREWIYTGFAMADQKGKAVIRVPYD